MDKQIKLTIFTPTFNREKTLPRLYKSIVEQKNTEEVEWLIIDDGSTDGTKKLIEEYIVEKKVQIRYIKKINGGKHTAMNVGIQNSKGEYFLCVDSDDFLEKNAIEDILEFLKKYKPNGVIAYKKEYPSNKIIGDKFPENLSETTLFDLINIRKSSGDRTLIYKTSLIKFIKIPEPQNIKFFPETYLYDRFDEKYKCVILPKVLCCCEYLEEGYSSDFRNLMIKNSLAMKWFYAERIDFPCAFKFRFQSAYRYVAFTLLSKCKEGKYKGKNKGIIIAAIPFGIAMYLVYEYYRRES